MNEPTEIDRAVDRARLIVADYREATGMGDEEPITTIGDLLADLFHYADTVGLDVATVITQGVKHHDWEVDEAQR